MLPIIDEFPWPEFSIKKPRTRLGEVGSDLLWRDVTEPGKYFILFPTGKEETFAHIKISDHITEPQVTYTR